MKGRASFVFSSPGKQLRRLLDPGKTWRWGGWKWGGGALLAAATVSAGMVGIRSQLQAEEPLPIVALQKVEVSEFSAPLTRKGGPEVTSRSYVVIDAATRETLVARDADTPRSIASLTKLMSLMVYLDMAPDLTEVVEVMPEDRRGARPAHTRLQSGWKLTAHDLVHAALIASENPAVEALARSTGLTRAEFVGMMNRKAQELGMTHSIFFDVSGLDSNNTATAYDVARMLDAASKYPLIHQISTMTDYEATVLSSGRALHYVNSNRLARYGQLDVVAGKTGYISDAGYCLTLSAKTAGRELLMVFLNAPSKASRFADAARAAAWVQENAAVAVASNN